MLLTITYQQALAACIAAMLLGCFLSNKRYGIPVAVGLLLIALSLVFGNVFVQVVLALVHR